MRWRSSSQLGSSTIRWCLASRSAHSNATESSSHIIRSKFPPLDVSNTNYGKWLLTKAESVRSKKALIHNEDGRYITYGDLLRGSRGLASRLLKQTHGRPPIALSFTKNCPEYAFIYCGLPLAGGIFSPANPAFNAEELARQIDDSQAQFLFTDTQGLPVMKKALCLVQTKKRDKKHIVLFDGKDAECDTLEDYLHDNGAVLDEIAQTDEFRKCDWTRKIVYLPYSSGTTGLPKGVMLSHSNILVNVLQLHAVCPHPPDQVVLCVLPLYHIYGMGPILGQTLWKGGTVLTMSKLKKQTFIQNILDFKVNFLPIVPPLAHLLQAEFSKGDFDLSHLASMSCGAASLDAVSEEKLIQTIRQHNSPNFNLESGYGMTETSPVITANPVYFPEMGSKSGSVGVPAPNIEMKVVDLSTGESLGPHCHGELCTRGPNVMLGYWNNPSATAATIKNGWLHTGDVGYYDEENYFYIVDRLKELIKYKGSQVAPAELEGILLQHQHIVDCAVLGKPDPVCGELPMAFVKLRENTPKDENTQKDIHAFVNGKLAEYKQLRGGIIFLEEIPKSAAGKILRRELKENYLK